MRTLSKPNFKLLCLMGTVALATAFAILLPSQAHAADLPKVSKGAHVYQLELDTRYSDYDLTGDGKPDTLKIVSRTYQYNSQYFYDMGDKLSVYVNGKKVFSKKTMFYYDSIDIKLVQLANKKCFLYMDAPIDNGDAEVCGVYRLKGSKLKQVINCNTVLGKKVGYHTQGAITKVSGNSLWMNMSVMSFMAGSINATYKFVYKHGTLKQTSKIAKLHVDQLKGNKSKAKKSITVYKNFASNAKKFTIKKGQTVKFLKVYAKGKTTRFQVRAGGKIGWIKADTWHEPPFEGVMLAG